MQASSVTVVGHLAADPVFRRTDTGLEITRFRIGSTPSRFDRATRQWVDQPTSWWNVSCFRALAANAAASLRRGDRVLVVGRPSVRDWTREDGRTGTSADIEAESIGHDLAWGTTSFSRVVRSERVDLPVQGEVDAMDDRIAAEIAAERERELADLEAQDAGEVVARA
ncbi:single-stranded DNA-binding protein [Quadrisphaera sp. DSM 44207]|uniref:single-stranded DNA-binding protein n=1 Tax=Quadrisphaera sp. DSM 44207 TaxID=1881057 RepID=UPI00088D3D26|nr:single-stranded DNA-binding protein [Quadrisphaera sp. DSM 44207]SDQ06428.1 single-strand DNA-binding protein [Quadrisphaera sp. DSM 44207]